MDADKWHFVRALEDLPEEVRQQAAEITGTLPGLSLRRRVQDELETIVLDSFGALEQVPLLHFLSHYPVTSYTYQVSSVASRGQRPDARKLTDLAVRRRCRATINLCAEDDNGDDSGDEQGQSAVARERESECHRQSLDAEKRTAKQRWRQRPVMAINLGYSA